MQRISPSFITFVSMKSDKRVLLGMSGGTDSSVAAMRLQEAGYEVTGVTFRFYEAGDETGYLEDARALALKLGMKHITYDARELFRSRIIRYFVEEYLRGRTPVPCTVCNNELKWALLAKIADEKGIYWISTGHYVRKVLSGGKYYIAPAADKDKDQTFFLWGLKQDILQRMLLPMGDITKNEARSYAAERGFGQVAAKKDSIGVCFCPLDYRSFLKREVPETLLPGKGRFVDEKGDFLGWHEGYPFYTVGQRRGLGIHLNKAVFVKETRVESNEVVLAPLSSLYRQEMWLGDWNLVENSRVLGANEVIVKIRYRKQANRCRVTLTVEGLLRVRLIEPLESIAPGQAAATSVLMSFSSTGSLVMLIQPSSSGAERMAITLSAMTRTGTEGSSVVGRVGVWKAPLPSNAGASAGPSSTGWAGMPGVTTGAGASGAAGTSGFAKKSSAAVSMASGTTGFTMGRGAGL